MKDQINVRYLNHFSVVAVNNDGVVVGFQLAQERKADDARYIYLAYAGVTHSAQGNKAFTQLIEAEKHHKLPLVAEVRKDNKSHMAERLMHRGFVPFFDPFIPGNFRWDPR
jgi:hypothetical protein